MKYFKVSNIFYKSDEEIIVICNDGDIQEFTLDELPDMLKVLLLFKMMLDGVKIPDSLLIYKDLLEYNIPFSWSFDEELREFYVLNESNYYNYYN